MYSTAKPLFIHGVQNCWNKKREVNEQKRLGFQQAMLLTFTNIVILHTMTDTKKERNNISNMIYMFITFMWLENKCSVEGDFPEGFF